VLSLSLSIVGALLAGFALRYLLATRPQVVTLIQGFGSALNCSLAFVSKVCRQSRTPACAAPPSGHVACWFIRALASAERFSVGPGSRQIHGPPEGRTPQ
jgi:hypothetical protein